MGQLVDRECAHHRVVGCHELEDHPRSKIREPVDHGPERDVASDDEVMDDGEAEHDVGGRSIDEWRTFETAPAEPRRRVGHVLDDRENVVRAVRGERPVELVEDHLIRIEGEYVPGSSGGQAREVSVVGSNVPHDGRGILGERLRDERGLRPPVNPYVVALRRVLIPARRSRIPFEAVHDVAETVHVGLDHLLVEPCILEL